MSNGILYISRHGESEWNTLGRWTGWTDVSLTEKGVNDAKAVGRPFLQGISFDAVYTSDLKRTHETLDALMEGPYGPVTMALSMRLSLRSVITVSIPAKINGRSKKKLQKMYLPAFVVAGIIQFLRVKILSRFTIVRYLTF